MFGLLLFHSKVKKKIRITESATREVEKKAKKKNQEQELPQYEQEQAFLNTQSTLEGRRCIYIYSLTSSLLQ